MNERHMRLANHVALNMENWRAGEGCAAWVESADRKCGRPRTRGYLCNRHHNIAVKLEGEWLDNLRSDGERRAALRAQKLPEWKRALARVEAEIERLDRPVANDRAAFGGVANKSIEKKRRVALSDANVLRMADLVARQRRLANLIKEDQ